MPRPRPMRRAGSLSRQTPRRTPRILAGHAALIGSDLGAVGACRAREALLAATHARLSRNRSWRSASDNSCQPPHGQRYVWEKGLRLQEQVLRDGWHSMIGISCCT
eukprot:3833342-Rhodomonas_salina.1